MHVASQWMRNICEKGLEVNLFGKSDTNSKTFRILVIIKGHFLAYI